MAIKTTAGFDIRSKTPIDTRLLLTKANMLAINDKQMPEKYFAVCIDDGLLYLYDKNAAVDSTTGKYTSLDDMYADIAEFDALVDNVTDLAEDVETNTTSITNLSTTVESGLASKQAAITSQNKLPYTLLSDAPVIPSKVSELTNDKSYVESGTLGNYYDKNAIEAKLAALNAVLATKQDSIDGWDSLKAQIDTAILMLPTFVKKSTYDTAIASINTSITGAEARLTSLETQVTAHATSIASINTKNSEQDDTIAEHTSTLSSIATSISGHTNSISALQASDVTLLNKISAEKAAVTSAYTAADNTVLAQLTSTETRITAATDTKLAKYRTAAAQTAIDNTKQDKINDIATIRAGAASGATALQSFTEQDPVYSASAAATIKQSDITSWNAKQDKITNLDSITSGAMKGHTALQTVKIKFANVVNTFTPDSDNIIHLPAIVQGTSGTTNTVTDAHINDLIDAKLEAFYAQLTSNDN